MVSKQLKFFLISCLVFFSSCSPFGENSALEIKNPNINWNTASFDYGDLNVGSSASAFFILQNSGDADVGGCGAVTLSDSINFSMLSNSCVGVDMYAGQACQVEIQSHPINPGEKTLEILRYCADNVIVQTAAAAITVNGVTPTLSISPLTHSFGSVSLGQSSAVQAFTLSNTGTAEASGCSAAVLSDTTNFSIAADTCASAPLSVSSSCLISIEANPASLGLKTATLSRSCTVGGVITTTANQITVTGTGSPVLAWAPLTYDFGNIITGSNSSVQIFTLSNTGNLEASGCSTPVISDTTHFTITANTCGTANVSASGGSCNISVRANPVSVGLKSATISRTCSVGGVVATTSNQITTTGVGSGPSLAWSPLTYDFGNLNVGSNSSNIIFTLTNSGNSSATTCFPVSISDSTNFMITTDSCDFSDLSPSDTCYVDAQANPQSTGLKMATIERTCIVGGTVTTTTNQITVTGSGAPTLAWSPLAYDFGSLNPGSNSSVQTFTLSNSGNVEASGCSTPVISDTTNFSITANTCGTANVSASGGSCLIGVQANPTTVGLKSATLSRTCSVGGTASTTSNQITVTGVAMENLNFRQRKLITARNDHTATLLNNGKVLVAGGQNQDGQGSFTFLNSAELYDPILNTWTATPSMNVGRISQQAVLLQDGKVFVIGGYDGGVLASTELYDPALNTWTTKASMSVERINFTATLLQDGKVLVVGGTDQNSAGISSVEVYDPALNTWTVRAPLPAARNNHSATLLDDGKVLVVGGYNGGYLTSVVLYDPVSNTWTNKTSLAVARTGHKAILRASGKIFVTGGYNGGGYLSNPLLYDLVLNTWSTQAPYPPGGLEYGASATLLNDGNIFIAAQNALALSGPTSATWSGKTTGVYIANHTATLLNNGKVLAVGGMDPNAASAATVEIFDPTINNWSSQVPLTVAKMGHTSTLMPDGKVLSVGGNDGGSMLANAEMYDPVLNTWTAKASINVGRVYHTATLLPDGKVLVVGGLTSLATAVVELYDPVLNTWTTKSSLSVPRLYHTATLLSDGKVLVVGGLDDGWLPLDTVELYDPVLNTWTAKASMPSAKATFTATLLSNGKVLVVGGNDNLNNYFSTVELYDPVLNTWVAKSSLSAPRYAHTATLLQDGKVLVVGGINNINLSLSLVEVYNPTLNTWSATSLVAAARYGHTSTLLPNGKVMVIGGTTSDSGFSELSSIELYDPNLNTFTVQPSGLVDARSRHTATLLNSGKVLVSGGLYYDYNPTYYSFWFWELLN